MGWIEAQHAANQFLLRKETGRKSALPGVAPATISEP
jgi:hypothetical protein